MLLRTIRQVNCCSLSSSHRNIKTVFLRAIVSNSLDHWLSALTCHPCYSIAKTWMVRNTVEELLGFVRSRAYGFCWRVPQETFDRIMDEFETFCRDRYGSLTTELSSEAKFEIWAYTRELA